MVGNGSGQGRSPVLLYVGRYLHHAESTKNLDGVAYHTTGHICNAIYVYAFSKLRTMQEYTREVHRSTTTCFNMLSTSD